MFNVQLSLQSSAPEEVPKCPPSPLTTPLSCPDFASPVWVKLLAWAVAFVIAALNVWLLYKTLVEWFG